MSRLVENADVLDICANQIAALALCLDSQIVLPEDGGSTGPGREALDDAVYGMLEYEKALKDLMVQTAKFLESKGAAITEADIAAAAQALSESGFFK